MSVYVVELRFGNTMTPELASQQSAYLATLTDAGLLLWSGPFSDRTGGLAILAADSEAAARSCYEQTPLAAAGAITWTVREWDARAGVVARTLAG